MLLPKAVIEIQGTKYLSVPIIFEKGAVMQLNGTASGLAQSFAEAVKVV